MPITISSLANMEVSTSLLSSQARASSLGLGQGAASTLALSNLMGKSSGKGLVNTLVHGMGPKSPMSAMGLPSGLQSIAEAAVSGMMQKAGLGAGPSLMNMDGMGSTLGGGSIISRKV